MSLGKAFSAGSVEGAALGFEWQHGNAVFLTHKSDSDLMSEKRESPRHESTNIQLCIQKVLRVGATRRASCTDGALRQSYSTRSLGGVCLFVCLLTGSELRQRNSKGAICCESLHSHAVFTGEMRLCYFPYCCMSMHHKSNISISCHLWQPGQLLQTISGRVQRLDWHSAR